MNYTNKHIILLILTIIILTFIYNYDVYIVEKNVPICKPIYVTKRVLTPDTEGILKTNNVTEEMSLIDDEVIEGFNTIIGQEQDINSLNSPGKSLSTFVISGVVDNKKKVVMDSVIKVLANIPTNVDINTIKQLVEYFGMYYETSSNLKIFYQNIATSTKIKEAPYNTKYAQLVLFLIGKFNNDVENCEMQSKNECKLMQEHDTGSVSEYLQNEQNDQNIIMPEMINHETLQEYNNQDMKKTTNEKKHKKKSQNIISRIFHDIFPDDKCTTCKSTNSNKNCPTCGKNEKKPAIPDYPGYLNLNMSESESESENKNKSQTQVETKRTCTEQCGIECPIIKTQPEYLHPVHQRDTFDNVKSWDSSGTNYYSL
jgi:hypothetical protein